MGTAVLLLPLHWKRLKGGTLAPATGTGPEGPSRAQQTSWNQIHSLLLAGTWLKKMTSRNGHANYRPTTDLLKLKLISCIFTQAIKGSFTWLKRKEKGNLTNADHRKECPCHTLLPLDSFWGFILAATHYNPQLHTVHLKWMEPVKDLKLYLRSTVHEKFSSAKKLCIQSRSIAVTTSYITSGPSAHTGNSAPITPSEPGRHANP